MGLWQLRGLPLHVEKVAGSHLPMCRVGCCRFAGPLYAAVIVEKTAHVFRNGRFFHDFPEPSLANYRFHLRINSRAALWPPVVSQCWSSASFSWRESWAPRVRIKAYR